MSKPTVVLVHGAFGDASSWRSVFERLDSDEYDVLAAAIPLRGIASDVSYLGAVIDQLEGPVVLVGHSYSGCVITAAGVSAGIDFALYLVAEIAGKEIAQAIQLGIEYDPAPPFTTGHPDRAPAAVMAITAGRSAKVREAYRAVLQRRNWSS